jgi:hypothetical protein
MWISVEQGLPKLHVPVLCIIESGCECHDDFIPRVLALTDEIYDNDVMWFDINLDGNKKDLVKKERVKYWMPIDLFPEGFPEAFER